MKQLFEENEFLKLEETEFESKDTGEVLFFLITCFLGIVTIYIYTHIYTYMFKQVWQFKKKLI